MTQGEGLQDVENVIQSLEGVSQEIDKIERARKERLKATHGRFNLFTTLLKAHDEVRLHTRYLTHLLDPDGKHDCGGIFLDSFLSTVEQKAVRLKNDGGRKGVRFFELNSEQCECVVNEHYTGDLGDIDIYLEFETAVLVIENKIKAADQPGQLWRYAEYAKKKGKAVYLFYLTLEGHSPSEKSLTNPDDKQGRLDESAVALISYKVHMLRWLETCLQATYSYININQALQQYESVINRLLGNTLEKEDMKTIKEMIKNSPGIIRCSDQIHHALNDVESDCINGFLFELTHALGERNPNFSELRAQAWGGANIKDPARSDLVIWKLTKNVILEYQRSEKSLVIGAFPDGGRRHPENNLKIQEKVKRITAQYPGAKALDRWGVELWLLDGEESFSNKNFLIKMLDSEQRQVKVSECVEKTVRFVEVVDANC